MVFGDRSCTAEVQQQYVADIKPAVLFVAE